MSDRRGNLGVPVALMLATVGLACSSTALGPGAPLDDGVPVGDCVDPTPAELASLGCPATNPDALATCDAPASTICRYPIQVASGRSTQVIISCSRQDPASPTWAGVTATCGESCGSPAVNIIQLGGAACVERPVTACDQPVGFPMPAQDRLDGMLAGQLAPCVGGESGDYRVEVQFEGGCPTQVSFDDSHGLPPTLAACLEAQLETVHWDCATHLLCGHTARILL
jgi:hypothetical protein